MSNIIIQIDTVIERFINDDHSQDSIVNKSVKRIASYFTEMLPG